MEFIRWRDSVDMLKIPLRLHAHYINSYNILLNNGAEEPVTKDPNPAAL